MRPVPCLCVGTPRPYFSRLPVAWLIVCENMIALPDCAVELAHGVCTDGARGIDSWSTDDVREMTVETAYRKLMFEEFKQL